MPILIDFLKGGSKVKVVAIIQARIGSTRLPGKVMKIIDDNTVLGHQLTRLKLSHQIDEIIVATTILDKDDSIFLEAKRNGVRGFRGSEMDVLSRYYEAATEACADIVVRLTSDCPLIDPFLVDEMISKIRSTEYYLISNAGAESNRTYPRGLDVEVMTYEALALAHYNAKEVYQREHVTPYLYENCDSIFYYKDESNHSDQRWTLDTEEDWKFIKAIYDRLYKGIHDFFYQNILNLLTIEPELLNINKHVEQAYVQKEKKISLRKAEAEDCDLVFGWANDPNVRKQSFSVDEISYIDHVEWFANQLKNQESYFFIAEVNGNPVGQIRLKHENDYFEISYMIDQVERGKGYGRQILEAVEKQLLEVDQSVTLIGKVKVDNISSIKAFEANHYLAVRSDEGYVFTKKIEC